MCLGLFFFSCLENLPDYFLTFPAHLAQKPGWVWDSNFSSSLCLHCQSPPTPKAYFFFASHFMNRKYLSLLEALDGGGR